MIDEDKLVSELWKIDNAEHKVHLMDVIDIVNQLARQG